MNLKKFFKGKNLGLAQKIIDTVDQLKTDWPLSVRQVYYRLVAAEIIPNVLAEYQKVSRNLTILRTAALVPWAAIEDRTRNIVPRQGFSNVTHYLRTYLTGLADDYRRMLMQGQRQYIEIWSEKDALSNIFRTVAEPYCIRVTICKGHISTSALREYAKRVTAEKGVDRDFKRRPTILFFGDFDASGVVIPQSIKYRLMTDHAIDANLVRCALNPDQIKSYNLPSNPAAIKKSDNNYKAFIERFGDEATAVELDALTPNDLKKLIKKSILDHINLDIFEKQKKLENRDRDKIRGIESAVKKMLDGFGYRL